MTGYVAPARYALTVLHRPHPVTGDWPGTDAVTGDPVDGWTVCGTPMLISELWQPVARRDGDRVCAGCESPDAARPGDVQETLL